MLRKDTDDSIINSLDLEKKLEIMEQERNEMIRNIINSENTNKNLSRNDNTPSILEKDTSDHNTITDTIKQNIQLDITQKTRDRFEIDSKDSKKNLEISKTKKTDILLINLLEYEIDGEFCVKWLQWKNWLKILRKLNLLVIQIFLW